MGCKKLTRDAEIDIFFVYVSFYFRKKRQQRPRQLSAKRREQQLYQQTVSFKKYNFMKNNRKQPKSRRQTQKQPTETRVIAHLVTFSFSPFKYILSLLKKIDYLSFFPLWMRKWQQQHHQEKQRFNFSFLQQIIGKCHLFYLSFPIMFGMLQHS